MTDQLNKAILAVPDWQAKDPPELLSAITAEQYAEKPEAERVWSIAGVAKEFGVTIAETVYGALMAAGLNGIAARFAATGLDATDPQWLANADALIAGPLKDLPAETQVSLKYVAFDRSKLFSGDADEGDVEAAKATLIEAIAASDAFREVVGRANRAVASANAALESRQSAEQIAASGEAGWGGV